MDFGQIAEMISTTGFPIFITMYILVRLESRMESLNNSITELSETIKTANLK